MDAKQFFNSVLSPKGLYCVVGIKDKTIKHQKFYESIDDIAEIATNLDSNGHDTYFALSTFQEGTTRKADNVLEIRALFLDLDCGEGKPYATQTEALKALLAFCRNFNLPNPTSMVNSGRGVHVYWSLSQCYSREEWLPVAERLKSACVQFGLEADPVVTADAARILRIPNTHNFKSDPASDVRILTFTENHVDINVFVENLPEALTPVPAVREYSELDKKDMQNAMGQTHKKTFIKLLKASLSGGGCKQVRDAMLEPNSVGYQLWLDLLSIAKHCDDKDSAIHAISCGYEGYSEQETEKTAASINSPHYCTTFETNNPKGCEGCPHKKNAKMKSPISLCMELREAESNSVEVPIEVIQPMAEGEEDIVEPVRTQRIDIPEYPEPYFRLATGGVGRYTRDKDGNTDTETIYQQDLYLTKRMHEPGPEGGPCYEVVHHTPRDGIHRFVLKATQLAVLEQFRKEIALNDITFIPKNISDLQNYMIKWVEKLKATQDVIHVRTQFGWTPDHKSFVIGDREVFADRVEKNPAGSRTAQYFPHFGSKGTLDGWKETVKFYNKPGFEEHQYMFGLSFGSPLMAMIPNISGCIFHVMSSETGHGKTTGMWGGASVWGNHKLLVLQGNDTANSAWNRAEVYKNIPLYVDELSNYTAKEASDFAYAISAGQQRNRLSNKGANVERYRGEEWGLNCGTSGNGSLLETISSKRAMPKGEAGRVLEATVHQRLFGSDGAIIGNALNSDLAANYGHAGVVYIQKIIKKYEATEKFVNSIRNKIIKEANLEAQHRHWSAQAATVYTGLSIAKRLGLIDWDLDNLYDWIINKLMMSRHNLEEMKLDVHEVIAQFYAEHVRNILRVKSMGVLDEDMQNIVTPDGTPMYKWVGRHEYDVSKFYVRPAALREWCVSKGHHFDSVKELIEKQLHGKETRLRLGRGTKLDLPLQRVIEMSWAKDDADKHS